MQVAGEEAHTPAERYLVVITGGVGGNRAVTVL